MKCPLIYFEPKYLEYQMLKVYEVYRCISFPRLKWSPVRSGRSDKLSSLCSAALTICGWVKDDEEIARNEISVWFILHVGQGRPKVTKSGFQAS